MPASRVTVTGPRAATLLLIALAHCVAGECNAPTTCYGETCDFYVLSEESSCAELEDAGCDCSGCVCGDACPALCFGKTCDDFTAQGFGCDDLESQFACSCNGCVCAEPATRPTTERPSTDAPVTTTFGERIFNPVSPDIVNTGTVPVEATPTTTTVPCPPGHVCEDPVPPPAATTTSAATLQACTTALVADDFCDDENNLDACDWDGGDCCGAAVVKSYCEVCECLDPEMAPFYNCGTEDDQCEHPEWDQDGYCDDANNNCICNWDGGDCCGADNDYRYCTECLCLDPSYKDAFCHAGCGSPALVGDDFCDDDNNNCGCGWDGGDCCGTGKHSTHCEVCACLDPNEQFDPDHANCDIGCDSLTFYADGFCDDANNVCGCDWDGGDCCGGAVNFRYCSECNCADPSYVCPSSGSCSNEEWLNDRYCDDGNNNCGCNWDHGDCCGDDNFYIYCDECACKDTAYLQQSCNGGCGVPIHRGDGYCDDSNNNCGCDWDGGDCCNIVSAAQKLHCSACECLDPAHAPVNCTATCADDDTVGDGMCDDANNVCGCNWDGGDCCVLASGAYATCEDCECRDRDSPLYQASPCAAFCPHPSWAADGVCDDGNNVCGCDWDGGDCCGGSVDESRCTTCACRDPDAE